jgi:hypothetical protein
MCKCHGIYQSLSYIGFEANPLPRCPIAHLNLKSVDTRIRNIVNDLPESIGSKAKTPEIQRIGTDSEFIGKIGNVCSRAKVW